MALHGIIVKTPISTNTYRWVLAKDWNSKSMIICLDGLSTDRHQLFLKKLHKLPLSFTESYEQSHIFQQALSRVISISGPLHSAFHMLQAIITLFKTLFQCAQKCLGWKKLNLAKVSDNYRLCLDMADILFDKLFRYIFYTFLNSAEYLFSEADFDKQNHNDYELGIIKILREFNKFAEDKLINTKDE